MIAPLPLLGAAAVIQEGIAAGLHWGAQLYVSRDLATVADLAFGESQPGVPMTTDTLMLWLSASKPVAAVALAQLRERGQLDFDDRVADFIPEFATLGKESITLKQILTHTAPIRFTETGWPRASWGEIIGALCAARSERDWEPGKKAGYSPFSTWFLLAEVVRRVDGRAYEDYVREEIFLPLGMSDSWLAVPPDRYRAYGNRIGVMMTTSKHPPVPTGFDTEQAAAACRPSGGGRGPMRELGRFYEMLLGEGRIGDMRLLSGESVRLLVSPSRVGMTDMTFKHVMDWGLGFILNSAAPGSETAPYGYGRYASARSFGHSGSQSSAAFADPEYGLAVAIVFNGMAGEVAHQKRIRAALATIYQDLGIGET